MIFQSKKKIMRRISMYTYDKKKLNNRIAETKKSIDEIKKMLIS